MGKGGPPGKWCPSRTHEKKGSPIERDGITKIAGRGERGEGYLQKNRL